MKNSVLNEINWWDENQMLQSYIFDLDTSIDDMLDEAQMIHEDEQVNVSIIYHDEEHSWYVTKETRDEIKADLLAAVAEDEEI